MLEKKELALELMRKKERVTGMKAKSYFGDKINKIKLYKKGKLWVAASMTFVTLGMAAVTTVKADTLSSVSSTSVTQNGGGGFVI